MEDNDRPLTMSVPAAGKRYYGLEREGSYAAAKRGDIPTVRVGRLLRVPVRAMERKLDSAWQSLGDIAELTKYWQPTKEMNQ
jgi:hypothetical protein